MHVFADLLRQSLALTIALALCSSLASAQSTVFDFSSPSNRLAASTGPGVLSFRGSTDTITQFGTCASFGLPLLPGGDKAVMLLPTLNASQGLGLDHAAGPNGPHATDGWVSNYSIVMDVLVPASSFASFRALVNTNPGNSNDADFFINPQGRIGISNRYFGPMSSATWHRIAIVVGAAGGGGEGLNAEGMTSIFIDGRFVGGHGGTGAAIDGGRWALYSQPGVDLNLFGDDNGQTAPIYVSSIRFTPERLSQAEVAALGGPSAGGIRTPGAAPLLPPGAARRVGIIAHRGNSADAPENTWEAIRQAIDLGAEAVEMDIRLSSDGVVVLMHDGNVNRTTNLAGAATSFSAAALSAADAGSWFDDRYLNEPAPTLASVLSRMRGTGVKAYLDVKVNGMADEIKTAMTQAGVTEQDIWLWAYNSAAVTEFNQVFSSPQIVTGDTPSSLSAWQALRGRNIVGVDLGLGTSQLGDPAFYANARAAGVWVSAYTVVDPETMLALINAGVDKMETDYPGVLRSLFRCDAEFDGVPGLTVQDIFAFLSAWFAGEPRADIDTVGGLTVQDIFRFLAAWFEGCN
jgi:glycerophosphoryl diester phosphodiesterase